MIKKILNQLKDGHNILIFGIVAAILSCEVGVPYIIGIVTGDTYGYLIGSVCGAFGLAPFTPFLPLCVLITFTIRKIIDAIRRKKGTKNE